MRYNRNSPLFSLISEQPLPVALATGVCLACFTCGVFVGGVGSVVLLKRRYCRPSGETNTGEIRRIGDDVVQL